MRCESCNTMLSPYEDSIRGVNSGQRLGLCLGCLRYSGIDYSGDPLAQHSIDTFDDFPDDLPWDDGGKDDDDDTR